MTLSFHKAKQFLPPLLKIGVFVFCSYFLWLRFREHPLDLNTWSHNLSRIPGWAIFVLLGTSLLSWVVESRKWQYLVHDVVEIRFRESLIQNLTSQAASFITPLRAGEFTIKAMSFGRKVRKPILSRVLLGNLAQMTLTIIIGLIGVVYCYWDDLMAYSAYLIGLLSILALVWVIVLKKLVKSPNKKLKWNTHLWQITLSYSALRYVLFSSNWLLLYLILGATSSTIYFMGYVGIFYLTASIIPIFQIFDISVKGALALFLFPASLISTDTAILMTGVIWLSNTIFPTLLGCLLLPFQSLNTADS